MYKRIKTRTYIWFLSIFRLSSTCPGETGVWVDDRCALRRLWKGKRLTHRTRTEKPFKRLLMRVLIKNKCRQFFASSSVGHLLFTETTMPGWIRSSFVLAHDVTTLWFVFGKPAGVTTPFSRCVCVYAWGGVTCVSTLLPQLVLAFFSLSWGLSGW